MLKTEASATVAARIVEIAKIIETIDIVGIAPVARKDCFVEVAQMPYCSFDLNSTASKSWNSRPFLFWNFSLAAVFQDWLGLGQRLVLGAVGGPASSSRAAYVSAPGPCAWIAAEIGCRGPSLSVAAAVIAVADYDLN